MDDFTAGLIGLARRVRSPERRARVAAALRSALAVIEDRPPPGVDVALDGLSEHLTAAAEHADFLREVMTPTPWR